MTSIQLKTPSVLAFERKLDPSDALFYSSKWENQEPTTWEPVMVRTKTICENISHHKSSKLVDQSNSAKLVINTSKPNQKTVDVAMLPADSDTLRVSFTLRVLGGVGVPSACNNSDYRQALAQVIEQYRSDVGFGELARRYAMNLANGRFLWRNRLTAEKVEVDVYRLERGERTAAWNFDAFDFPLRHFYADSDSLEQLADVIQSGLEGDTHVLLEIVAHARMGRGQEVFPSQELILDQGDAMGRKSRTLYQIDGAAALHSQKIGNALRTIDDWYPDKEVDGLGPIPVQAYGAATSKRRAYRQPKQKMDFYSLLDQWVLEGQAPDVDQQHFVMASLIRGGVFGATNKD